jgi:hypothetical protein
MRHWRETVDSGRFWVKEWNGISRGSARRRGCRGRVGGLAEKVCTERGPIEQVGSSASTQPSTNSVRPDQVTFSVIRRILVIQLISLHTSKDELGVDARLLPQDDLQRRVARVLQ